MGGEITITDVTAETIDGMTINGNKKEKLTLHVENFRPLLKCAWRMVGHYRSIADVSRRIFVFVTIARMYLTSNLAPL
jgi:hypothetical protein